MACTAAILTTAACSTDISPVDDPGEVKIMLTANVGSTTRTTTTNLNVSHIALGTDNVGVFIQKEGATSADGLLYNIPYSSDGSGGLTASNSSIYFPMDGSRVNIYACAPRISTSSPDENVIFNIATNQSSDADYIASDLMIGLPAKNPVAKTTSAIPLTFGHKMAKIIVDFTGLSEDLTGLTLTTCDLFTSANVNIKNNTITTDETATKPITIASIDAKKTAACVIPPQTVAAGTKLLCLDYHGIKTYYTTPADITFESGKVYTFNMSKLTTTINLANLTGDATLSVDCAITGTTSKKITIANGVKVTLDGVTINNQIVCQGDATIYLKGTNKVTSTTSDKAGIEVGPAGTTLTINGDANGSIEVEGGSNGAGIGSGKDYSTIGNITINSGIITATGGDSGAGIGIGNRNYYSSCGNISIDMTGKSDYSIKVKAGEYAYCIGNGTESSAGAITITNATITLDDSNSHGKYFDPTPTFKGTVVIKDTYDNDITVSITHN